MRTALLLLALSVCGACTELDAPSAPADASDAHALDDAPSTKDDAPTAEHAPDQTASPGSGGPDPCNGLDDDGDGAVDEDGCPNTSYACADPSRCTCTPLHRRCGNRCLHPWTAYGTCNGACTALDTLENCGACGQSCGAGQTCVLSQCRCPSGDPPCAGYCPDQRTDPNHCGGCGRACTQGRLCVDGRCVCPNDQIDCGGGCIDLRGNDDHCGRCRNACGAQAHCVDGVCVCNGTEGRRLCDGVCADLRTDLTHCGGCFQQCATGQRCEGGVCVCPAGRTLCNSACVDLATSSRHCGACNVACPTGSSCVAGACVCPGARSAACLGSCVDLGRDLIHCGACNRTCARGQACIDGVCRAPRTAPSVNERVGNRSPRFLWPAGAGAVDLCEDARCARVAMTFAGEGGAEPRPPSPLRPGLWFWRVRPTGAAIDEGGPGQPFRVDARDASAPARLPSALELSGDGLADLAVLDARARVSVFHGRRDGVAQAADRVVALDFTYARATLRVAGDVDGDGHGDLTVTDLRTMLIPGGELPWRAVSEFIRAVPLFDVDRDGLPDWCTFEAPPVLEFGMRVPQGSGGTRLGASPSATPRAAAPVGDVNGDGYLDALVGAPADARAYVFFGSSAGLDRSTALPPAPRTLGYGAWTSSAGDVNGDGFADVLVGLGASGAVVYTGAAGGPTLHRTLLDPSGDDLLVAAAGDLDGDGFGDLAAVPRARGEVWLYRGSRAGLAAMPLVWRDARWAAVESASADDLDGDGRDDLVLGAPSRDSVYVVYGAATLPPTRVTTLRGEAGSEFGRQVL